MRPPKKFEDLTVYIIGPMESDPKADYAFLKTERALLASGIRKVINPCRQEKDKVGMNVSKGQAMIADLRAKGEDAQVSDIYDKIWELDTRNVQEADILVAHLKPGVAFTGTAVEATLANIPKFIKYTKPFMPIWEYVKYKLIVKPWLVKNGWSKPVFLLTPDRKTVNGTFAYQLVIASGGKIFRDAKTLVKYLKERYQ